jgi:hypothetical protein
LVNVVGDLFHPLDNFPVEGLLNCDVRHRNCQTRAMPVLLFPQCANIQTDRNNRRTVGSRLLERVLPADNYYRVVTSFPVQQLSFIFL